MKHLFPLLVVLTFLFLIFIKKRKSLSSYFSKQVLSAPEQVLYWRLQAALDEQFVLLSQVSFSAFIGTNGGDKTNRQYKFARSRQKVADFVVCSKAFQVLAVVELDDSSHRQDKDEFRDSILQEAGIAVIRWHVSAMPSVADIRKVLL